MVDSSPAMDTTQGDALLTAAVAAAGGVHPPGSSPGGAAGADVPVESPKRGRSGVKPLAAFNAVHLRQDVADDEVAKIKTELIHINFVLTKARAAGFGADQG